MPTERETDVVTRVTWSSGVVAYLRFIGEKAELATSGRDGSYKIREIDGSAYLADIQQVKPETEDIPIEKSPWGEQNGS